MIKKTLATFTGALLLTTGLAAPVAGVEFTDVSKDSPFYNNLESVYYKDIMTGYDRMTPTDRIQRYAMKPNNQVTRAQAAKMIVLGMGYPNASQEKTTFNDMTEYHWAHDYVAILENEEVVSGRDGEFNPNDSLTRAQVAKMLVLGFDLPYSETDLDTGFTDVNEDHWSAPYVKALVDAGITTGTSDTTFSPNRTVKRYELAAFIDRIYENEEISDERALVQVRDTVNRMREIYFDNVVKTDNGEQPIPFEDFQEDLKTVVTDSYLPQVKENYDIQCRSCDAVPYYDQLMLKVNYKVLDNNQNAITIQTVTPGEGLIDERLVKVSIVKEDGNWKVDEYITEEVPQLNLTVEEAANMLENRSSKGFAEDYQVYKVEYLRSDSNHHYFNHYSSYETLKLSVNFKKAVMDVTR